MLLYVKITKLQNGVDLSFIFVLLHLYACMWKISVLTSACY